MIGIIRKSIDGIGGQNMRYVLIMLLVVLCSVSSAAAQVSIGIGPPNLSIGLNIPLFPQLVRVPGYPVYYAPSLDANFFFYDGLYWLYQGDNWYASSWYNGPWGLVAPEAVPAFVLRVPVLYYRHPPAAWSGWRPDAPPRWGEHWGPEWARRRSGWEQWDRRFTPAPAPLPLYQRRYSGDRYPRMEQQRALHSQNYRYQPQQPEVRQHYQQQGWQGAPGQQMRPQGQQMGPQGQQMRPQGQQQMGPQGQQMGPQGQQQMRPQGQQQMSPQGQQQMGPQGQQQMSPQGQQQMGPQGQQQMGPQGQQMRPQGQQQMGPQGQQQMGPQGMGAPQEPGRGQEQSQGQGRK